MPLNIQRLNAKKSHPNDRVVFIKPLKGRDEAIAQDYLERIAAQCLPIMKEHYLSVTTLEEYEPNPEFVGRNFNSGEIIQLVLKARSGHWLPFNYVQMVMMHELAHCVQMNHSRAFWKVRNLYAEQLRVLWSRGYTGEGMWGRGALLATGEFERNTVTAGEELPEHLCGGTYRSRRRKRKAKPEPSYQERKQRRIEKKFGKNGVALGADTDVKAKLEKGRTTQAAPRVAQSKRGRELRAAAALARFEQQKQATTEEDGPKDEDESTASETESDYEDAEGGADDALDIDGKKLLDAKGNHMVRVCGDENLGDHDAANELRELQSSMTRYFAPKSKERRQLDAQPGTSTTKGESSEATAPSGPNNTDRDTEATDEGRQTPNIKEAKSKPRGKETRQEATKTETKAASVTGATCTICSFQNEAYSVTCGMCSHVLDPTSVPGTWRCRSAPCQGSSYLNAGDRGVCGVCGQRKGEKD
ncbi:hypothetical protein VP1G_01506 [Cytospora mali]|uniref:WLM domain-containing protein n=1 Tax=Cytospora mali TaxID=578113 RepID=A0A194UQI4_CYTMA|nr:hypothetical protein VP1G_01506 [Valsa mali var. pyri (nom. inval.)]